MVALPQKIGFWMSVQWIFVKHSGVGIPSSGQTSQHQKHFPPMNISTHNNMVLAAQSQRKICLTL